MLYSVGVVSEFTTSLIEEHIHLAFVRSFYTWLVWVG
jgi:hypothetical protein